MNSVLLLCTAISFSVGFTGAVYGMELEKKQLSTVKYLCPGWREGYTAKIVSTSEEKIRSSCNFCDQIGTHEKHDKEKDDTYQIVHANPHFVFLINANPYVKDGQVLVIPYAHKPGINELSDIEIKNLALMLRQSQQYFKHKGKEYLSVGVNYGRESGGTVPSHMHVHVIPFSDDDLCHTMIDAIKRSDTKRPDSISLYRELGNYFSQERSIITHEEKGEHKKECLYCNVFSEESHDVKSLILRKMKHCCIILDNHPKVRCGLMIIPVKHVASPEGLSSESFEEMLETVALLSKAFPEVGKNTGYNFGFTVGDRLEHRPKGHMGVYFAPRWLDDFSSLMYADLQLISLDIPKFMETMRKKLEERLTITQ